MSRAAGVNFGFYPASASPASPVPETAAQVAVSRADLWALARAARAMLRATQGRHDTDQFRRSSERLERCLENLPPGVWA